MIYKVTFNVFWEKSQKNQSLHNFIKMIERICMEFDDHKQEIFNLLQALKMLSLLTWTGKESIDKNTWNIKNLWKTVKAFGVLLGIHKGLVKAVLTMPGKETNPSRVTADELNRGQEEASEALKVAVLISGTNMRRYGWLKEQLANNYLLGTD